MEDLWRKRSLRRRGHWGAWFLPVGIGRVEGNTVASFGDHTHPDLLLGDNMWSFVTNGEVPTSHMTIILFSSSLVIITSHVTHTLSSEEKESRGERVPEVRMTDRTPWWTSSDMACPGLKHQ